MLPIKRATIAIIPSGTSADRGPDNRVNFLYRVALLKRHRWHRQIRRGPKVIGRTWHNWLLGIGQMVL